MRATPGGAKPWSQRCWSAAPAAGVARARGSGRRPALARRADPRSTPRRRNAAMAGAALLSTGAGAARAPAHLRPCAARTCGNRWRPPPIAPGPPPPPLPSAAGRTGGSGLHVEHVRRGPVGEARAPQNESHLVSEHASRAAPARGRRLRGSKATRQRSSPHCAGATGPVLARVLGPTCRGRSSAATPPRSRRALRWTPTGAAPHGGTGLSTGTPSGAQSAATSAADAPEDSAFLVGRAGCGGGPGAGLRPPSSVLAPRGPGQHSAPAQCGDGWTCSALDRCRRRPRAGAPPPASRADQRPPLAASANRARATPSACASVRRADGPATFGFHVEHVSGRPVGDASARTFAEAPPRGARSRARTSGAAGRGAAGLRECTARAGSRARRRERRRRGGGAAFAQAATRTVRSRGPGSTVRRRAGGASTVRKPRGAAHRRIAPAPRAPR